MSKRAVRRVVGLGLALLASIGLIAACLPAATFVVGDGGVKLIAVRAAAAHPSFPIEIPLPKLRGTSVDFVDPFFRVHDSHVHAITPDLFPLLIAPGFQAFGYRGLYIWSLLGWVVWCLAWAVIGSRLDGHRDVLTLGIFAAVSSPLLFYGLEFWEHAPAAGLVALATMTLLLPSRDSWKSGAGILSGFLFGVSFLLRPEAALAAVSAVAALTISERERRRVPVFTALGFFIAIVPALAANHAHFQSWAGLHVTTNAQSLEITTWLDSRIEIFTRWFLLPSSSNAFIVCPALLLGLMRGAGQEMRGRRFLRLTAGFATVLVFLLAPNDGGGQWGPRYLLIAVGPMTILASDWLISVRDTRRPRVAIAVVGIALIGSVTLQLLSIRKLNRSKTDYGVVSAAIAATIPEGGVVLTDVWWIDQIAASLSASRTFLYVDSDTRCEQALAALRAASISTFTVVRSGELEAAGRCLGEIAPAQPRESVGVRQVYLSTARLGPLP